MGNINGHFTGKLTSLSVHTSTCSLAVSTHFHILALYMHSCHKLNLFAS